MVLYVIYLKTLYSHSLKELRWVYAQILATILVLFLESLDTITGEGSGLTANVYFVNNSLNTTSSGIVTVTNGGFGYRVGDIVGIPSSILFGSGATLRVQTLGSVNTLFLDEIQGNFDSSIAIGNNI